jgi:hypothetical protein
MTGFTGYLWFKARTQRPPPHWHKYGPTYLTALAGVLISLDIVRHVLKDHGINYLGRLVTPRRRAAAPPRRRAAAPPR